MKKLLYLVGLILFIRCQSAENKSDIKESVASFKPVTELEYSEIVDKVMFDVGKHIEYHGEPINEEAKADIKLSTLDKCGDEDCGQKVKISNSGEKKVKVTLYIPFKVATMESHTAKIVRLAAGQSAEVGCSHFCYNGKSYQFQYTVAGAEYDKD